MNRGLFNAQINTCWKIVSSLELSHDRIWYPMYRQYYPANFRGLTYLESWEKCLVNNLYNFQLTDHSLIQFRVDSFNPLKVGYSYYECPYQSLSYTEFVESELGFNIDVVRDSFMKEYSDYLNSCNLKDSVTPVRYDYDTNNYREGVHPASHIHFGYLSNIRIGTRKVLVKPLSFLLLVIRQIYPNHWTNLLENSSASIWCRNIRMNLDDVHTDYWNPKDLLELFLQ